MLQFCQDSRDGKVYDFEFIWTNFSSFLQSSNYVHSMSRLYNFALKKSRHNCHDQGKTGYMLDSILHDYNTIGKILASVSSVLPWIFITMFKLVYYHV